ncbi:MAG: hypothetical protein HYX63_02960 [Gammaproteobacteria bacterium]|nr:hypothetical protein [Gammaproteobacteria bacterium]
MMNSKFAYKTLAAAVAVACTAGAHALPMAQYAENAGQVTLRVGGSSAHDAGLNNLMRLQGAGNPAICAPGTLDIYHTPDNNNKLYFCTGGTQSGAAGLRLAVFKRSNGGSGTGVGTLVRGSNLVNNGVLQADGTTVIASFLDTAAAAAAAGVVGAINCASPAANFMACTDHTTVANTNVVLAPPKVPGADSYSDAGISDEEPNVFKAVFAPVLNGGELGAIPPKGISGVIFGLPVTKGVFQRLQVLQFDPAGATNADCNPNTAGYTVAAPAPANIVGNTERCMPSLTKEQVQGLFTQNIGDWSLLSSSYTAGLTLNQALAPAPYNLPMADTGVYIERRVPSSGTEHGAEIQFMQQGCVNGAQLMATAAGGGVSGISSLPFVVENSSGGTIPTNLTAHDTALRGALGVLTSETVAGAASQWRFVKLNGVSPTVLNTVKGTYDYFYESTMQWRTAAVGPAGWAPALAGGQLAVATALSTNLGNPNVLNNLNSKFPQLFGFSGLVGNAIAGAALAPVPPLVAVANGSGNPSDVLDKPIALATRGAGGGLNACLSPVTVNQSQASGL